MRQHRLYKAVWYWSEDENKLSVFGTTDKEKTKTVGNHPAAPSSTKLMDNLQKPAAFYFTENIDQNQQMKFRQRYQRGMKPHIPNVVTMQDVKDTVMFLANGFIPSFFMELFCSMKINLLLRAVILYIQLYLKVWEDLEYRSISYRNQRLKHYTSIERETLCKQNLSKLRSRIGQEYAIIIAGEGEYKKYHHMNNTLNRSYTDVDMMLYDYLSRFITRVVWVALGRVNFKEIEMEIARLFHFKDVNWNKQERKHSDKMEHEADGRILHGDGIQFLSKWQKTSPVISDIFINQEVPETLQSDEFPDVTSGRTKITGLEAALKLPEELLSRFGITLGILGLPRDNFDPLLTVRQKQKSLEEEEFDILKNATAEEIKPKIKMYEYIRELETTIDLNRESTDETTADILQVINLYEKSHLEDSNRSHQLWKLRTLIDFPFYTI